MVFVWLPGPLGRKGVVLGSVVVWSYPSWSFCLKPQTLVFGRKLLASAIGPPLRPTRAAVLPSSPAEGGSRQGTPSPANPECCDTRSATNSVRVQSKGSSPFSGQQPGPEGSVRHLSGRCHVLKESFARKSERSFQKSRDLFPHSQSYFYQLLVPEELPNAML